MRFKVKFKFLYRGFKAQYRDQRAEISALVSSLSADDIAIDVGANKGSYLPALSRAVPQGKVVAFEPQPALAEYLRRTCTAAGFRNVVVEGCGVSSAAGSLTLYVPGEGETSPGATFESAIEERERCRHIEVPVVTLDSFFSGVSQRIGALKVDVEGHELEVLRGATNLIREHSPVVVECENRHLKTGSVFDVLEYMKALGYRGHFVHRHKLLPIEIFQPDTHQSTKGERYWDHPDYCNNFILVGA